jgi:hypothetical protein
MPSKEIKMPVCFTGRDYCNGDAVEAYRTAVVRLVRDPLVESIGSAGEVGRLLYHRAPKEQS